MAGAVELSDNTHITHTSLWHDDKRSHDEMQETLGGPTGRKRDSEIKLHAAILPALPKHRAMAGYPTTHLGDARQVGLTMGRGGPDGG